MGKINVVSTLDEQEIAEARGSTVPDMLYDVVARTATTSIGQFVYKRIDNLLWTVEKTARWSLPQPSPLAGEKSTIEAGAASPATEESEDVGTNISGPPLIRPLPWLLFLPALIVLRLLRTGLSMGARAIGRGPVLPSTLVSFLQNKRRKLRALKYRGQRLQRIARLEKSEGQQQQAAAPTSWLARIILPLKMVICTRPYGTVDVNSDVAHAVVFRKDRCSVPSQKRSAVSKKRNLNQREAESADEEEASDEDSFVDAGCKELLEKYANVADDSSFNVDDISSASDDSSPSQSDADPSPKKPNLESGKVEPQQQNGGQQPPAKTDSLKRSASDNKNGIDAQLQHSKDGPKKSINAGNRSKSAADLEKGNKTQALGAGADGNSNGATNATTATTTPSKSIPNLSSSPENNENRPINQNISVGPAAPVSTAPTAQIKSPTAPVLKPMAKQSPTMSDVRTSFQQQKQQQCISNGGKNRNKKAPTQSAS